MSVTGKLGWQIRTFAVERLKMGYADFIATDAHNTEQMPPLLSKAYREIAGTLDKPGADRIFIDNPKAVIENREIEI